MTLTKNVLSNYYDWLCVLPKLKVSGLSDEFEMLRIFSRRGDSDIKGCDAHREF